MRYVLAAMLICAVGVPAASALPTAGLRPVLTKKADSFIQAAKHDRQPAKRQPSKRSSRNSGGAGGIHPLVGSGDY